MNLSDDLSVDKELFSGTYVKENTTGAYKAFLSEKHANRPKYNLPEMAQKLGKIGGTQRAGKGKDFIGNFYWPRNDKMDIWDLFSKKFI